MGIPATGWLGAWRIKRSAAEDEIIDVISLLEAGLGAWVTRWRRDTPLRDSQTASSLRA